VVPAPGFTGAALLTCAALWSQKSISPLVGWAARAAPGYGSDCESPGPDESPKLHGSLLSIRECYRRSANFVPNREVMLDGLFRGPLADGRQSLQRRIVGATLFLPGCYGHPRVMRNYFVGAATTTSVSALHSPTVALLRMSTSRPMATLRNL